ncbi:MAG: hypothetical protein H3C58_03140 [Fimbriimonadaceae bacterium]|nr:hypothetical protein [Fimbriimonadaceae bacterium]
MGTRTRVEPAGGFRTFAYAAAGRTSLEVAVDEELPVEMQYDEENRMIVHVESLARTTYAYDGDGLKRSETTGSGRTTLIWDGADYLQGRS